MKIKFRHILLVIIALSFSCGPKKGIVTKKEDYKKKTETVDVKEETKTSETDTKVDEVKTTKAPSSVDKAARSTASPSPRRPGFHRAESVWRRRRFGPGRHGPRG